MVPSHARVVIIGGGIMGCGVAYHLAHEGWSDVVLLEKAELTSGSTWHAAGQITRATSSYTLGKCVDYNIGLYAGALEAQTGQSVTWHGCGSLRMAYSDDDLDWLHHIVSVGRGQGVPMEIVGIERAAELHPFYNFDGIRAALHTPDDGHLDPAGAAFALAKGARQLGVTIVRQCRATGVSRQASGEWLVETEQGPIAAEHVVNAGGAYARQMALWSGYALPTTSMTHHYLVTDTIPEYRALERELPVVRDDRVSGYIRMEQKSGLIGIYEKSDTNTVWDDHCPWESESELFEPHYERIMPWLEKALERVPILGEYGIKRVVHGALSHPPDGNPLIGPAPGLQNYWCCCGIQIGIGWGPALTRELARWIVHGAADLNMREFDPRRFGAYAGGEFRIVKAKEDYSLRHEIPFPHFNRLAARPVNPSALYDDLKAEGAVFEEVYGHERPQWFAPAGTEAKDIYGFRRTRLHEIVGAEVRAARERAGIMDISAFAKVEVSGADAAGVLDRLVPNRLPSAPGRIALTHLLTESGRIELEITVTRLVGDRFYLACAPFFEQRLVDCLSVACEGRNATIANRSTAWNALALTGPRARDILAACTDADLGNAGFPWLTAQNIAVAGHEVLALRLSYAGELGWELHGPRDAILGAWRALKAAGVAHGLASYGSFAMDSMRMEKAFKGAGELTNEVTLPEADVMRFVRLDKDFRGRAATEAALAQPLRWVCAYLEVAEDGDSDGSGGEAVLHAGKPVGMVTSIAFGHAVGKVLAFAYVAPDCAAPGTALEVVVMDRPRAARVLAAPAYDPGSLLPRTDTREAAPE